MNENKQTAFEKHLQEAEEYANQSIKSLGYESISEYMSKTGWEPHFEIGWFLALEHIKNENII